MGGRGGTDAAFGLMLLAQAVVRAGQWPGLATATVTLGYDERFLRRRRLVTTGGAPLMVDLPETTDLRAGDALVCEDGQLVAVAAAEEDVLVIRGDLVRLAWHIGNRHTPCQIETDRLVIRADHVLQAMLTGLGASVAAGRAPFTPEGGAYGLGRTLGHTH
jgi:urease accessory protein